MKIRIQSLLSLAAAVAFVGATAGTAKANLLLNGDFESVTAPLNEVHLLTLAPGDTALTGWSITGPTIDVVGKNYWLPAGGDYSVDLTGTSGAGGIQQTITTQVGKKYLVTLDIAPNPENYFNPLTSVDEITIPRILEISTGSASATWERHALTNSITSLAWETIAWEFTATDTETTIAFKSLGTALYTGMAIDNVSVDEVPGGIPDPRSIPEPASLGVLALGGLLMLRRRNRN